MEEKEIKYDCQVLHIKKVNKAKCDVMEEKRITSIAEIYKALSDDTRLKIINVLENNELCVNDMAVVLNMTKSAVSHQLKYLKNLNIVSNKKKGREVMYFLTDDHVRQIFNISCFHITE